MAFPIEMIVDVGVRSFKVHLEDDGVPVLRFKIIQGPKPQATSQKKPSSDPPPTVLNSQGPLV